MIMLCSTNGLSLRDSPDRDVISVDIKKIVVKYRQVQKKLIFREFINIISRNERQKKDINTCAYFWNV